MTLKKYLGISAGFHDAAVSMIDSAGNILYAGHAERYSKRKNDAHLNDDIVSAALAHGTPDEVAYYERPWVKKIQQLYSGQYSEAFDTNSFTLGQYLYKHLSPGQNLNTLLGVRHSYNNHHKSHAAAGFQTSPFEKATVVVIDAIGELDTISIWGAEYDKHGQARYKKLWGQRYPHSIGLFYSAITKRLGLHPLDEEYITMGMAAYGRSAWEDHLKHALVENEWDVTFKENLHLGLPDTFLKNADNYDIAASAQQLCENLIYNIMRRAMEFGWSNNLVYMGGVALNCSANRNLGDYFENIWIMPCPGDGGSGLGAAALAFGGRISWTNAFLGDSIPGEYPVNALLDVLLRDRIVGVANGKAEFGPRAFGNRSLLADPRGPDIKDQVNEIKRRQKFRPFAPVIMEEMAHEYFDMPGGFTNSRYMQSVATCRRPDLFPAIVHADGTSRVQTVPKDGSGIRELLEKWFVLTGCPMLLNTSLNIRGEPVVNDRPDADRFEKLYNVKVCS
jgi:carbamoyltransferase